MAAKTVSMEFGRNTRSLTNSRMMSEMFRTTALSLCRRCSFSRNRALTSRTWRWWGKGWSQNGRDIHRLGLAKTTDFGFVEVARFRPITELVSTCKHTVGKVILRATISFKMGQSEHKLRALKDS